MLQVGRVVSAHKGMLEVCFDRPEACQHCGACEGGKHHATVKFPGNAPVGSQIAVDMPERKVLRASFLAYVIPLVMLIAGLALGMVLFEKEAYSALLGLGMMAASYFILKGIEKMVRGRPGWLPQIVAVYEEGEKNNGNEAE